MHQSIKRSSFRAIMSCAIFVRIFKNLSSCLSKTSCIHGNKTEAILLIFTVLNRYIICVQVKFKSQSIKFIFSSSFFLLKAFNFCSCTGLVIVFFLSLSMFYEYKLWSYLVFENIFVDITSISLYISKCTKRTNCMYQNYFGQLY